MKNIQVIGDTMFAAAVRSVIEETDNWELRECEGRIPQLCMADGDHVAITLFPSEPVHDGYACAVVISGEYFTPATEYSYEALTGERWASFI